MTQNPQPVHWPLSVISGGQYPLVFSLLPTARVFLGQKATHKPHPLQRSASRNAFEVSVILSVVFLPTGPAPFHLSSHPLQPKDSWKRFAHSEKMQIACHQEKGRQSQSGRGAEETYDRPGVRVLASPAAPQPGFPDHRPDSGIELSGLHKCSPAIHDPVHFPMEFYRGKPWLLALQSR